MTKIKKERSLDGAQRNQGFLCVGATTTLIPLALHQGYVLFLIFFLGKAQNDKTPYSGISNNVFLEFGNLILNF